jgi:hypothetical protein
MWPRTFLLLTTVGIVLLAGTRGPCGDKNNGGASGEPDGWEIMLVPDRGGVSCVPTVGKSLMVVAAVGGVLHFRVFDGEGKMILDADETKLWRREIAIEDLRKDLEGLWPPRELAQNERRRLTAELRSALDLTRTFPSDFRRLIVCAKAAAFDRGFLLEYWGTATSWDSGHWSAGARERFEAVANEEQLPHLGNDPPPFLSYIGRRLSSPGEKTRQLRRISVDLDTGGLGAPAGVDLKGLQAQRVTVHLRLARFDREEVALIDLSRKFPERDITLTMTCSEREQEAPSHSFLVALESKLAGVVKGREK